MDAKKSVLGKCWSSTPYNESFISDITRNIGVSDLLARMVSSRVSSLDEAVYFLDPKLKFLLPDPFHLKDMQNGVERVVNAVIAGEKISIFADYDVDGATSSALLKNVFDKLGTNVDIYVPDRIIEGYGPNPEAMQKLKERGISLIITVDCGSVAFEAIEYANGIGLDVIVIDHHISLEDLPKAVAVINPNRLDETSEYKNLAAVGVSFLFAVALCKILKEKGFFDEKNIEFPDIMKQLDLVALGTVCDVMQLTGLNRAFVHQGLKIAKQRNNIGYSALCDVAALDEAPNCYHLGFVLGPRINAGGRVGKSYLGSKLLSSNSYEEAILLAQELDKYNNERKVIELLMLEEAEEIAKTQETDSILFIVGCGWHPGVIGIIAGRLKERYNKPVVVIALNEKMGKASCRSVKGIDFGSKIVKAKQNGLLVAGGGHAMAAGFTVEEHELDNLHMFLSNEVSNDLNSSNAHLNHFYDLELTTSGAHIDLLSELNKLEPFGNGNPAPIFKFSGLYVLKADIVGSKHIKVIFAPNREAYGYKTLSAIAFNAVGTPVHQTIMSPVPLRLSVLGKLKINNWQGNSSVQLHLEDLFVDIVI